VQQRKQVLRRHAGDLLAILEQISIHSDVARPRLQRRTLQKTSGVRNKQTRSGGAAHQMSDAAGRVKKERSIVGPHLRSSRTRPLRSGLARAVEKTLTELGLGSSLHLLLLLSDPCSPKTDHADRECV